MTLRRFAIASAVLLGCAASPARRAPRYCPQPPPPPASATGSTTPREPASSPRGEVRTVETVAGTAASTTTLDEESREREEPEPPCLPPPPDRAERIAGFESQIAQGLAAFAAPDPSCRDVCRAAAGICAAAREICRLTGDNDDGHPMDARCARARGSCADAGRQRDGRCPACPPP